MAMARAAARVRTRVRVKVNVSVRVAESVHLFRTLLPHPSHSPSLCSPVVYVSSALGSLIRWALFPWRCELDPQYFLHPQYCLQLVRVLHDLVWPLLASSNVHREAGVA